jgi:hypothetical protein
LSNLAAELTPEDIIDYLKSLKLIGNYTEEFLKLEVDGITMFYSIEEDSLESLGVDIKRDRLKIKVQFERWLKSKKKAILNMHVVVIKAANNYNNNVLIF